MEEMQRPLRRSELRLKLGMAYYGLLRRAMWLRMNRVFTSVRTEHPLPYSCASHRTPLLRRLKGYVDGMVLRNGTFCAGVGGGLCQLSNLIFWMTLHTPLTVIERHRHGYDVFPDADRTQPFGSGATCFYPHGDLMIRNDTQEDYQLFVSVGEEYLVGEWRTSAPPEYLYRVVERNHEMKGQYWGGYTRHNELYRQVFDLEGRLVEESLLVKNAAIMMYAPFLTERVKTAF